MRLLLAALLLVSPQDKSFDSLLTTLAQDKDAEALYKAMKEKVESAKTLRLEFTVTIGEAGRTFLTFQGNIKAKGKDRWMMELKVQTTFRARGPEKETVSLLCDGRKVIMQGSNADMEGLSPEAIKPEEMATEIRRGVVTSMAGQILSMMFDSRSKERPASLEVSPVSSGGKEKIGDRDAQILEYTLKYDRPELNDQVLPVKLWVDVAEKRPFKREIHFQSQLCTETITAFALDEEIPDSEFSFQSKKRLAQALAAQIADSARLYGQFTGRHPKSLDDLANRPASLEPETFWPDGGFVLGGVVPKDPWGRPFELRAEADGLHVVSPGADSSVTAPVPPVTHRAVGAPTDRLKKTFTARVQLQLLASAVRAFRAAYGELPKNRAALSEKPEWAEVWPEGGWIAGGKIPNDPWGGSYRIAAETRFVRVQAGDPKTRALTFKSLTAEEQRRLEEIGQPRLTDAEKKEIAKLLDEMGDDDLETREKALAGLKTWGPAAVPLLEDRMKIEKDSEARGRLQEAHHAVPSPPPAYRTELAALSITISGAPPGRVLTEAAGERNASACLKTIATAEADFRANDRDGNHVNDFWVGDVAGLYSLKADGQSIKLIEVSVALADAAPLEAGAAGGKIPALTDFGQPAPKAGYYFRVMTHDNSNGKSEPYATETSTDDKMGKVHNNSCFGVCAYPAEYGASGRRTFIINEGNTIFWKDTAGEPVLEWPSDDDLKAEWNKMD